MPRKILKELPFEIRLKEYLQGKRRLAVAFSGGCDSSLLAAFAARILSPENVLLLHAATPMTFERENHFARELASRYGTPYQEISMDALSIPEIVRNDSMRCYHCKKYIFTALLKEAEKRNFHRLADGANIDDKSDWRPGAMAADELGVLHPFTECGLGKREIRLLSRRMELPTWHLPAAACLASRIPTGTPLDPETIQMAGRGEEFLESLGFHGTRVRCLGSKIASLEFRGPHLKRAIRMKESIQKALLELGFSQVNIHPNGYKQGNMNHAGN